MLRRFSLAIFALALALALPGLAAASSRPVPGEYIVVLKSGASLPQAVADHRRDAGARTFHIYGHALNGYAAKLSDAGLARVKADPRVDYVVQNQEGNPLLGKPAPPPSGPGPQTLPTGVDRIDGELSSQLSGDKLGALPGPPVAIVDTGIDSTHPDLNVVGGVNCLDATNQYNDHTYNDQNGHGSHVAGIVGARDDAIGVVGVAPGVPLYAVRVLDSVGSGSTASQLCGIDWVTNNTAATGIKVANFSQASLLTRNDDNNCGYTNNDPMHQAMCRSAAAGVLWSTAAGNSSLNISTNYASAPMSYDEVLTSTAVSDANGRPGGGGSITCRKGEVDDKYASFSDWVSSAADIAHTIAMPGVCINSTWKGGTYSVQSGTSMAAPTAAGAAELCIASGQCPGTPAETIQKLVGDSVAYNQANPSFGFTGDPQHAPVAGQYYGYILRAAGY